MQNSYPTRKISQVVLGFLMWTLLASCAPVVTSPLPTPTAPVSVSTDSSSPKIIPFFTTESDPNQLAILQTLIVKYQSQRPNVEVDIVMASPASRGRRLISALASGADLGIFEVEPTLMPQWVESGYLLPLNDIVANIGEDDFVAGSLYAQNGQVYAVPYAVSVYGLWVRKDLLEQAGLPIPTTYEEVLNAARVLTQGDMYGIALPAGQNIATVNYFSIFLWQNGGDYFTCDGELAFGQPQALQAVKRWAELAQYAPFGYSTWSYREQIDAFLNQRVAMSMYGGRLGVQLEETHPELSDKVTVIFPPFGDIKVTLGVRNRFAIAKGTKNQQEAKDFLQWLVSGDQLLDYDLTVPGHMIPPLKSVREKALVSPDPFSSSHPDWIHSFYDWSAYANHPAMNMGSVANGQFQRSDVVPPWAWEVFGTPGIVDTMLQDIANGKIPDQAWQEAVTKMEQAVATWKSMHPAWKSEGCH
ncbi:MAG: sugar ABC transporter substrate-binding protein [Anaerolineaceae bacterium]|nr:MAG: sugar ABC transporter substrate-binding protein [Anaerolineaceae bacterium]